NQFMDTSKDNLKTQKYLYTQAWNGKYFDHKVSEAGKISKLFVDALDKNRISERKFLEELGRRGNNFARISYVAESFSTIDPEKLTRQCACKILQMLFGDVR